MALSYLDTDNVIAPFVPQTGLLATMTTSIGMWTYGVLTESVTTAKHSSRVAFAKSVFEIIHRRPLPKYKIWRPMYTILQNQGLTPASTDSAVQTAVNVVMENLFTASL